MSRGNTNIRNTHPGTHSEFPETSLFRDQNIPMISRYPWLTSRQPQFHRIGWINGYKIRYIVKHPPCIVTDVIDLRLIRVLRAILLEKIIRVTTRLSGMKLPPSWNVLSNKTLYSTKKQIIHSGNCIWNALIQRNCAHLLNAVEFGGWKFSIAVGLRRSSINDVPHNGDPLLPLDAHIFLATQ